jgi:transcriptional regulator with XRE-family HTH domain
VWAVTLGRGKHEETNMADRTVPDGQLRRAREARRLTQAEVAERIAALAWWRDHTRLGVGPDMVSKWERGEKRPSRLYRELLCLLYEASPAELGLPGPPAVPAQYDEKPPGSAASEAPWAGLLLALGEPGHLLHPHLINQWEDDLMKRRELLKSMGLAAAASALGSLTPPVPRGSGLADDLRPSPATIDGLASLAARYQQLYHGTAPQLLMAPITAHLRTVEALLARGTAAREWRSLLINHSQVAQLAGRVAFFDLQDPLSARGYFMTAYDSAIAAKDSALAAGALGHLGFVPAALGQWAAAASHLEHARVHADAGAPPAVRSWLAAVSSEIRANAGDERGALTSIDAAKKAVDGASLGACPPWFDFYDQTRLQGFEGYALLRSGHTATALRRLDEALGGLEPKAIKQRTVFLTDLATAHVRQGDIDRACELAVEAATAVAVRRYATCVSRLRAFRSCLRPYATSPSVRELDDAMVEL